MGEDPVLVDVVVTGDPVLTGYLMPLEGQEPAAGADIGTKVPSIMDPLRLKYQLMAFKVLPLQLNAGVNPPDAAFKADVSEERVCVAELDGVIPWFANQL